MDGHINAVRPREVAAEVEALLRRGCRSFSLSRVDGGGMLDQERLGAARYAAGLQAEVALVADEPAASIPSAHRR